MKLQIEIELGNAAFQAAKGPQIEVARILREYCNRIQYHDSLDVVLPYDAFDNTVGSAILIDEKE